MSHHLFLPQNVSDYVAEKVTRESGIQSRLRLETAALPNGHMQTTPDQAAFLAMLVKLSNARHAIEIGTFTGYGALAIAAALPENGRLICCDTNAEWPLIGQKYWQEAGVAPKINLRIAPADETLQQLLDENAAIDFAFIDANKKSYDRYYELCLKLLPAGGLIVFDNMLRRGDVADTCNDDKITQAINMLNQKIKNDPRVDASFVTIGDGMMLVRKI